MIFQTLWLPLLAVVSGCFVAQATPHPPSQVRGQIILTNQTVPLDISARITIGGRHGYEQVGFIYGPEEPVPEYHFAFLEPVPEPGDYVLRVESKKYEFQSYFVRVGKDDRVEVGLFDERSMKMLPGSWLPHPLMIHPLRLYPLVDPPPPSMSLVTILKSNPLIWLLGLGLILMLAIPKLMENLDPETLKEVRESQKEMHQNMASLQSFDSSRISKFLAGAGTGTGEGGGSSSTGRDAELIPDLTTVKPRGVSATTGVSRNGGGKSKKRK